MILKWFDNLLPTTGTPPAEYNLNREITGTQPIELKAKLSNFYFYITQDYYDFKKFELSVFDDSSNRYIMSSFKYADRPTPMGIGDLSFCKMQAEIFAEHIKKPKDKEENERT